MGNRTTSIASTLQLQVARWQRARHPRVSMPNASLGVLTAAAAQCSLLQHLRRSALMD